MQPEVSVAKEALRTFIIKFNDKAVFKDDNVHCPDIMRTPNVRRYITTTDDIYKLSTYTDVVNLLKICYLEFIKATPEKKDSHVFRYITEVYKEMLALMSLESSL